MNEVAQSVPNPPAIHVAEWIYPHAPPMRAQGDPALAGEWSFLFDPEALVIAPDSGLPSAPTPAQPTTPIRHSGGILKSAIR
jgi:hypothetical protein